MRSTTFIFAVVLIAITMIGGCRTNLGEHATPLVRLVDGFGACTATLNSIDACELEMWIAPVVGLTESNLDGRLSGGGGPQFAKLPLRRVARPGDLPEAISGWLVPEKRGTKSLQLLVLPTSRRGPPIDERA